MTRFATVLAALAGLAGLAACGDSTGPATAPARIRVVNAAYGISTLQVLRAGSATPIATVDFGATGSTCVDVPAGDQSFTFQLNGGTVGTAAGTLQPGGRYTLMLAGAGVRRAFLASDDVSIATTDRAYRFINATDAAGDVHVSAPGAALSGTTRASSNLGPINAPGAAVPDLIHRAAAHSQISLYDVEQLTDPRMQLGVSVLTARRAYSIVFFHGTMTDAFWVQACE